MANNTHSTPIQQAGNNSLTTKNYGIDTVKIHPHHLTLYQTNPNSGSGNQTNKNTSKLKQNNPEPWRNEITHSTQKKLKEMLTAWLIKCVKVPTYQNNKQLMPIFLTLTLPSAQTHTDKELKRQALDRFIVAIKRNYNIEHYFWKCELQKNGNIHFHLFLDRFISYASIHEEWTDIMDDLGYMTAYYSKGFVKKPPFVNVKTIKNAESVTGYITKYVTKNNKKKKENKHKLCEKQQLTCNNIFTNIGRLNAAAVVNNSVARHYKNTIEGRLWGCSDGLRRAKLPTIIGIKPQENPYNTPLEQETADLIQDLKENANYKVVHINDKVTCILLNHEQTREKINLYNYIEREFPTVWEHIKTHLKNIFEIQIKPKSVTKEKVKPTKNKLQNSCTYNQTSLIFASSEEHSGRLDTLTGVKVHRNIRGLAMCCGCTLKVARLSNIPTAKT
jgi:ribosomal protein S17E